MAVPQRDSLAGLLEDFDRLGRETAVVRYLGVRRRVTTYGELAALARRFAAFLAARNIAAGDRVLLWGANSAEWMAAYYGSMLRGVIVVPLDATGTAEFARRVAADVRPGLVVGDGALLAQFEDSLPKFALAGMVDLPDERAGAAPGIGRDTPLQILFTSGTTGDPKGIVHTHGNILSSIEPIAAAAQKYLRYERYVHPLRFLHTLPLSHVFGQTMGLWIPAIFGAELHFEDRLVASRVIERIRNERISVLVAVPRVLALLRQALEAEHAGLAAELAAARGIPAHKRWWRFRAVHRRLGLKFWALVTGGSALPPSLEEFWNGLGFVLVQGYGMTETSALVTLNHPFHVARGSIGKPLPGREIKLGGDGEILVRGPMISSATWSGGTLQPASEWLATGDLAEVQATGDLRFLGRKSEVIVLSSGLNLHPEDVEAALELEPEVAACAVIGVDGPLGPEPYAVLALRSSPERATAIVRAANTRLADFQRVRQWRVWPEPDLPRTATGKVKRAAVAEWVKVQSAGDPGTTNAVREDWLLTLIAGVTGRPASLGEQENVRLEEDLRLDSLGRVQVLAALEQRLGLPLDGRAFGEQETLPQLRGWISAQAAGPSATTSVLKTGEGDGLAQIAPIGGVNTGDLPGQPVSPNFLEQGQPSYPRWPWTAPVRLARFLFQELVARPLVALLAGPRVRTSNLQPTAPLLIIANHVTTYDVPLLLYALSPAVRRRTAVAMSGEMLEGLRRGRTGIFGPLAWLLITALYNVFPLPRRFGVQSSFDHIGKALDRGFHVILFPEGTRSSDGRLARFQPGIGLLVKQAQADVLPMALVGLGELKTGTKGWFRSGAIEVRAGQPLHFADDQPELAITERLRGEVARLLEQKE